MAVRHMSSHPQAQLNRKGSKEIPRRDIHFQLDGVDISHWNPLGSHVSHLLNALSITFPEGEKFFIESARYFKDQIKDPKLLEDLQGFIGQEAMHGREHRVMNAKIAAAGYPAERLEADSMKLLRWAAGKDPLRKLATTCALEHFTAVLADVLLRHPELIPEGTHEEMRAMWNWHAVEENEHKAVCYDVYQTATQNQKLRGYAMRVQMMVLATALFWQRIFQNQMVLIRKDGTQRDWKRWVGFARFAFTSPGALRHVIKPYLDYYKPGFHPWQHDNRRLVDAMKARYDQRDAEALPLAA
jgi:predicted metal-dependent hydrolase